MALIDLNPTPPATLGEKQALASARIKRKSILLYNTMKQQYELIAKDVKANQEGLTQNQVINGLGSDGAELTGFMTNIKDALNALVPGTIV